MEVISRPGRVRGGLRHIRILLATALLFSPAFIPRPALAQAQSQPQPLKGELTVSTAGGYGRLVIRLDTEMDAEVRVSSGVLIVQFKQPVNIAVDRAVNGARQYFGAARRDPDGRALRFALAQKVKVSTMIAGERLFVDLLPENWTGEPPGLPREIVEDLARRAKEAERLARQKLVLEAQRKIPMARVRVASQSTFTRYIFELPDLTPASTERAKDRLTLNFGASVQFDLSDAKLSLPKTIDNIDADNDGTRTVVTFSFAQPVDVRAFREDSSYVVDVTGLTAKPSAGPLAAPVVASGPLAGVAVPETVPAKDAAKDATKDAAGPEAKADAKTESKQQESAKASDPSAPQPAAKPEATKPGKSVV